MGSEISAADFLARPNGSRAGALMGRQSDVLAHPSELDTAFAAQCERIGQEPDLVAPSWTVYAVQPDLVEFWQGDPQRRHTRLRYRRTATGWDKELLWP